MDDNEQKVNNNVVANAQPPALIKKYKRVRPRHEPVSISVAITPLGDLLATPIFDSHRRITSYSVLSAHSVTLVPPRRSFPLLSSFPSSLLTSLFSSGLPSFSLSYSLTSSHIYLIWADCTTTAIKR